MRVGSTYLTNLLADYHGLQVDRALPVTSDNLKSRILGIGETEILKIHELNRERVEELAGSAGAQVITITRNPLFATISRIRFLIKRYREARPVEDAEIRFLGMCRPLWSRTGTMTLEQIIEATRLYPELPPKYFREVVQFGKNTDVTFNRLMVMPRLSLTNVVSDPVDSVKIDIAVDRHSKSREPDPEILGDDRLTELLTLLL